MRAHLLKIVLPLLLAIAICAAPSVFASGHADVGDDVLGKTIEAAVEEHKAAVDRAHGDVAAAEHEEALAAGHTAQAEHAMDEAAGAHGDGHAAPMITPEKLKDLFWRTANFIALIIILVKVSCQAHCQWFEWSSSWHSGRA